jgi:hypothetical protein
MRASPTGVAAMMIDVALNVKASILIPRARARIAPLQRARLRSQRTVLASVIDVTCSAYGSALRARLVRL